MSAKAQQVHWHVICLLLLLHSMPHSSKQQLVLDSFAEHHRSMKRAHFRYRVTEFLADIPSSDPTAVSEDTESISNNLSVLSVSTNSADSSSSSDESIFFSDIESLVIKASNSQCSRLANYISTARIGCSKRRG